MEWRAGARELPATPGRWRVAGHVRGGGLAAHVGDRAEGEPGSVREGGGGEGEGDRVAAEVAADVAIAVEAYVHKHSVRAYDRIAQLNTMFICTETDTMLLIQSCLALRKSRPERGKGKRMTNHEPHFFSQPSLARPRPADTRISPIFAHSLQTAVPEHTPRTRH